MILFFSLLILRPGLSQDENRILEIRDSYNRWQPIINKKFTDCERYFSYAWGDNYQYEDWFNQTIDNDSMTLHEIISVLKEDDLGTYINNDIYSFSGDWYVAVEYYYDIKDKLYFIFWKMNTFYAEEPVTVEKRLYFSNSGIKIQELQSVYKMNTKEKYEGSFMDRDVDYKLNLKEIDFLRVEIKTKKHMP